MENLGLIYANVYICYGLNNVPQNSYIEVLNPNVIIWR